MNFLAFPLALAAALAVSSAYVVSDMEWKSYKAYFAKSYPSMLDESTARCNLAFNKQEIESHNMRAAAGLETYTLAVNQFSDWKFNDFAKLFPPTTEIPSNAAAFTLPQVSAIPSFSYGSAGFTAPVRDQGMVCNSGWAYAVAVAVKLFDDVIHGNLSSPPVSAQNFIDCAGGAGSCVAQVAQSAFDYLATYRQRVYPTTEYSNAPLRGQGMCILPPAQMSGRTLAAYSSIADGDDATLQKVVNFVAPVVIKFNPGTFEFMHYKAGVFTQPSPIRSAAHYMTVVGYGTDGGTGLSYWLVQNSFGTVWGEIGFMRVERNPAKLIANDAIFPSM